MLSYIDIDMKFEEVGTFFILICTDHCLLCYSFTTFLNLCSLSEEIFDLYIPASTKMSCVPSDAASVLCMMYVIKASSDWPSTKHNSL